MASGDMKGFFRQRKNSGGIAKPKPKSSTATSKAAATPKAKPSPSHSATLGSDVVQPSTLPHPLSSTFPSNNPGGELYGKEEEILRQFDMNMAYGPCLGMTRLARWERASRLGLNPPQEIHTLLENAGVGSQCLWDGRV